MAAIAAMLAVSFLLWPLATATAASLSGAAWLARLPRLAALIAVVGVLMAAVGLRIDADHRPSEAPHAGTPGRP